MVIVTANQKRKNRSLTMDMKRGGNSQWAPGDRRDQPHMPVKITHVKLTGSLENTILL
jgi:hypothetical protein